VRLSDRRKPQTDQLLVKVLGAIGNNCPSPKILCSIDFAIENHAVLDCKDSCRNIVLDRRTAPVNWWSMTMARLCPIKIMWRKIS